LSDKKPDHHDQNIEQSPNDSLKKQHDLNTTRAPSSTEVSEAEKSRTNASDGSLRRYSNAQLDAQEASIELFSDHGTASGKTGLRERDLKSPGPHNDSIGHIFESISKLPPQQQLEVLGAGLWAGLQQYSAEQREKSLGQVIGTVQGVGNIAINLATIADFAADLITGNKQAAADKGGQFGESIGQMIVGGTQLFQAADNYLFQIGYTGDYAKPFKDISTLGHILDEKWSKLPIRERERIKAQLVTELVGNALLTKGGATSITKAKTLTEILDQVALESKNALEAAKASGKTLKSVHAASQEVASLIKTVLNPHAPAFATEGLPNAFGAIHQEESLRDAFVLEKRLFTSKLDSRHRLTSVEAARENAHIKGHRLDETAWKKLTPKQKAEQLTKDGYELLEDPPPLEPFDSSTADTAFRGDTNPYSPVDRFDLPKSHIDKFGNLVPADISGKYMGRDITLEDHILSSANMHAKAHSPFTSVGSSGVIYKYGKGHGMEIDMVALRKAIAKGEVKTCQIIEHQEAVKAIENSHKLSPFEKKMALRFARKDNEFIIKGVVPARFIKKV